MTTMYINSKPVGNGSWKFKSIISYCQKKKEPLFSAYSIIASCSGAYTKIMDLTSGKYIDGQSTDHFGRAGINI